MNAIKIVKDDLKDGVKSWAIASIVYIAVAQADVNPALIIGLLAYRVLVAISLIQKLKQV